jgi:IS30 family transposase
MTYDNGVEMANHKWLANKTGINIYFAHPYSSWERGTNENTNGLIRRFFPKGTDFNKISLKQLKDAQNNLNNRPRKVLGYKTPNEKMNEEIGVFEQDIGLKIYNEIFAKTYPENTTRFN